MCLPCTPALAGAYGNQIRCWIQTFFSSRAFCSSGEGGRALWSYRRKRVLLNFWTINIISYHPGRGRFWCSGSGHCGVGWSLFRGEICSFESLTNEKSHTFPGRGHFDAAGEITPPPPPAQFLRQNFIENIFSQRFFTFLCPPILVPITPRWRIPTITPLESGI